MRFAIWIAVFAISLAKLGDSNAVAARPNFLIAISDDQSYPHASAYGCRGISTPAFDRVAKSGVLFENAFTPAPGCSPMRAAFLTGRHIWQIEHAGTHASSFSKKYQTFQKRLEDTGYFVGYTGKGWSPGNWKVSGRDRNPAGPAFSSKKLKAPAGIRSTDYAANFSDFLKQRTPGKPFSFWYGGSEPHRAFKKGIGRENGMKLADAEVPAFLPDRPEVRDDILDYYYEIQWFDQHLGRMLDALKKAGELDNTIVIVTSDNGMAFPRAKANCYEFGIHMPLAVSWPAKIQGGRKLDDVVNLIDVTATIYEAANVSPPATTPISGRSLMPILVPSDEKPRPRFEYTFSGRERHSSSRFNSLGYPQRCIRSAQYLYIRNFHPERWPAGPGQKFDRVTYSKDGKVVDAKMGSEHGGYHDIDACPTLSFLIDNRDDPELGKYLQWSVAKRSAEELFDIRKDPACLHNLATKDEYGGVIRSLGGRLDKYLIDTRDPRSFLREDGNVFETYPRYSALRWFPEPEWFKKHPEAVSEQLWLEIRRPKANQ